MTQSGRWKSYNQSMAHSRNISWIRLLAEGAAIVVSILLAFWIEAWWEHKGDLSDEIEIVINLESEFAENREKLLRDIGYVSDYSQAARRLLTASALNATANHSVESIGADLWHTLSWHTANLNTAALDSVISAGRLDLIRNDALRAALARWPSRLDDMREGEMFEWLEVSERYRPFVGRIIAIPPFEGTEPAPPDPDSLRRLLKNKEFLSLLSMRLDVSLLVLEDKDETLTELARGLDLLRNNKNYS